MASTNLTGVFFSKTGPLKLLQIYKKILNISSKYPKDCAYRLYLENIIAHRICIINEAEGDRQKIEEKIDCGSIESLISQAQAEFYLSRKMLLWKPWEPLMEQAPPGQWDWPPY